MGREKIGFAIEFQGGWGFLKNFSQMCIATNLRKKRIAENEENGDYKKSVLVPRTALHLPRCLLKSFFL
jgi:hypothetical protein